MKEIVTTIAVVLALSVFFGTGYVLWAKSQKPKARFQIEPLAMPVSDNDSQERDEQYRPVMQAICLGDLKELRRVLTALGPDLDLNYQHTQGGDTPLTLAVSLGRVNIVVALLTLGADENTCTCKKGRLTPLMLACHNGSAEIYDLLIKYKANVALLSEWNTPALYFGVQKLPLPQFKDLLQRSVQAGVSPSVCSANGSFPLVLVTDRHPDNIGSLSDELKESLLSKARLLLEAGAQVNQQLADGRTCLSCAADNRDVEAVRLLMEFGANPDVRDKSGRQPYDFIEKHGKGHEERSLAGGGRMITASYRMGSPEFAIYQLMTGEVKP